MILLVGSHNDPPLRAVAAALAGRHLPFVVFDPDDPGALLARAWSPAEEAQVLAPGGAIDLGDVTACYLRPAPQPPGSPGARAALASILAWADVTTSALVINPPAAAAANTSKPYQLSLISRFGFAVPATLTTTCPQQAATFAAEHGRVVYKSVSGQRSIVNELDRADADRLRDVANCPTQFQQLIDGNDIRAHIIGDVVHAVRITGGDTDYRYVRPGQPGPTAARTDLDQDVCTRLVTMCHSMGLSFAGVDLRENPEGQLYCLEVNPAPGFTYYERLSGSAIAPLVADLLTAERQRPPTYQNRSTACPTPVTVASNLASTSPAAGARR